MHATKEQIKQISVLKKRADFLYLNKSGKRWVSQGLVIQAAPRPPAKATEKTDAASAPPQETQAQDSDTSIRFGITVTKKTFKSAVKRNRIKRRLRAVACEILPAHARQGCDYVLIGREATLDRPYDVLKKDLIWCLNKMGFAKQ